MEITPFEFNACLENISPPLAVATSGGADSLCLLLLTHRWAEEKGGKVIGLTVDHGLRPESKDEALRIHTWAKERNIEHIILNWSGEKPRSRLQEKARQARYKLLTNWCKEHQISTLLLGHHQQDQEETFWMRLSAGSGLDGLSGMTRQKTKDGITILRPLLQFPKDRLKETLRAENQLWIEDPTNKSLSFLRGRLRSVLENEGLSQRRLIDVMDKLRVDADFIRDALYKTIENSVQLCEGGYIVLDKQEFETLHPALSKRLISYLLQWFSGKDYPPSHSQILGIVEKLKISSPFTAGGVYWYPKADKFILRREVSKIEKAISLTSLDKDILWDQRYWLKVDIKKVVKEETILAPLGAHSSLKKKIHSSIPSSIWPTLPTLWLNGKVVSIPHLCYSEQSELDYRKFFHLKSLFYD